MKINILFLTIMNLVNGFWNAGLQRKFFGGGHNHRGSFTGYFSSNVVGLGESLLESIFLARNLAFLYNENSMQKQKSDDWSAGRIRLLSQIIDQQIKTNRHDHRVHSDPL